MDKSVCSVFSSKYVFCQCRGDVVFDIVSEDAALVLFLERHNIIIVAPGLSTFY